MAIQVEGDRGTGGWEPRRKGGRRWEKRGYEAGEVKGKLHKVVQYFAIKKAQMGGSQQQ